MWALIVLIVMSILDLLIAFCKHGDQKVGYYNFWAELFAKAILWWLFYEAGLFDKYL